MFATLLVSMMLNTMAPPPAPAMAPACLYACEGSCPDGYSGMVAICGYSIWLEPGRHCAMCMCWHISMDWPTWIVTTADYSDPKECAYRASEPIVTK